MIDMRPKAFKVLVCGITNEKAVEAKIREIMPDLVIVYHHEQPRYFVTVVKIEHEVFGREPGRMLMISATAKWAIATASDVIDGLRKGGECEVARYLLPEDPKEVKEAAEKIFELEKAKSGQFSRSGPC